MGAAGVVAARTPCEDVLTGGRFAAHLGQAAAGAPGGGRFFGPTRPTRGLRGLPGGTSARFGAHLADAPPRLMSPVLPVRKVI